MSRALLFLWLLACPTVVVQRSGGRVELIPLEPNQSTTAIVGRISAD